MKKLILILTITLFSVMGFSQGAWEINSLNVQTISTYTMDGDTSWIFNTSTAYIMGFGYS